MHDFSVLMAVHAKENPAYLRQSLESIIGQSLKPSEIVLVKDGALTPGLDEVIDSFIKEYPGFKILSLRENKGLGNALNSGLELCSNELVARMDSDDIALPDRFRRQVEYMLQRPGLAACGGHVEEFRSKPGDVKKIKKVPVSYAEVKKFAKYRNPMNHPAVMFRKSAILAVGSYKTMPLFEDYYLWLRLLKHNYQLENIDEILLYFRADGMLARRRGRHYLKREIFFIRRLKEEKLLNVYRLILIMAARLPFRILPAKWLRVFYDFFLRRNGTKHMGGTNDSPGAAV